MQSYYYIVRPKQGLVLDVNLRWKKSSECAGAGPGIALGLEMTDSLNIAAWVSFDGISAIPYPESTACSLFERDYGREYSLNKKEFSHSDFAKAVCEGRFPDFLLRKPLNKAEKKMLFGNFDKKHSRKNCACDDPAILFSKKDLRGDNLSGKGAENMYYIVNTKRNSFLSKSLSWIDIGSIKKNKKLMSQLFCVKDDIAVAQTIALWITPSGEVTCPCTPSTLKRKYRLVFPNTSTDSFSDGVRSHKYPSFLSRKPCNRRETVAFQMALRDGIKDLEERTLLFLGKLPGSDSASETECHDKPDCGPTQNLTNNFSEEDSLDDPEGLLSDNPSASDGNESFSFQHHVSSVTESSDLIRSVIETSVAFGKMMSEAPNLVAQKKLDLEMIHRQLLDLDHVAEFYSLNASDGYRMNKTRKEYLQQRRVIKNEIAVLEMMTNFLRGGATPSGINGFVNGIMNLDRRCYTTRALTVSEVKDLIRNPKTQAQILGETYELSSVQESGEHRDPSQADGCEIQ